MRYRIMHGFNNDLLIHTLRLLKNLTHSRLSSIKKKKTHVHLAVH
jgi:hypothetical protein